ncbi:hypothetical protein FKW77_007346 [Venturia effusa]|uniref:S-adenosyl-L-methionine-dependent methyltransferase n=1 Tax=Venturia effusa TaxID=50376 RepID=A0A517LN58_9PEZI|nr:hypothetical protein FKW77_007346 [Venturia effusa]
MPRLVHRILRSVAKENPLLPLLLRTCRDLPSARRELQWLTEHAIRPPKYKGTRTRKEWWPILLKYCKDRGRGKPLQYILGSEWFGPIELVCKPNVLIPRQETAAAISYLIETVQVRAQFDPKGNGFRILDLCTGTGCIPLLLAHELARNSTASSSKLGSVLGADLSIHAWRLAWRNWRKQFISHQNLQRGLQSEHRHYQQELVKVDFVRADVMSEPSSPTPRHDAEAKRPDYVPDLWTALKRSGQGTEWDILICNPPYISPNNYNTTTSRSVRNFEPKLALVPPTLNLDLTDEQQGDLFYPRLLHLADEFKSRMLLMEVADLAQAERVAAMAQKRACWSGVEIWCDQPGMPMRMSHLCDIPILGQGHGRSVFCWREMEMRSVTPSSSQQAR